MKKTIKEWQKEYGLVILDSDGFGRKDKELYKKKFTEKEFREGLFRSTICTKGDDDEIY